MTFIHMLKDAWQRNDSLVCVGLDPEPSRLPESLRGNPDAIFEFCRAIVDATADLVCCFKPQIAHFAAHAAEGALERLIAHIHATHPHVPVILDAKRGDIGSTAAFYADEAFERYRADAVTVNPYLGRDALEPFLSRADKGVVVLCRTSNAGARDLQDLDVGGRKLYQHVAQKAAGEWRSARSSATCRCSCRVSARRAVMSRPSFRTAAQRTAVGSSSVRRARSSMPTREPGSRTPQERRRKRSSQRSIGIADSVIAIYVMP